MSVKSKKVLFMRIMLVCITQIKKLSSRPKGEILYFLLKIKRILKEPILNLVEMTPLTKLGFSDNAV